MGMDETAVKELHTLSRRLILERLKKHTPARLTLDIDGSVIGITRMAEGMTVGYDQRKNGQRSYYLLFCTAGQSGQVLDVWHRPGGSALPPRARLSGGSGNAFFIVAPRRCLAHPAQIPRRSTLPDAAFAVAGDFSVSSRTLLQEGLRQSARAPIGDETLSPGQRRFQALTELMRLRRTCCDPQLPAPEAALPGCRPDAFAKLAQVLVANRHKALVFSQFVDYLRFVRARLDALGTSYQYLAGRARVSRR
jgi:SNF2 family DNA or RNA helicase